MFIVLGGTGHVGSETAEALLGRGCPVKVVTRGSAEGAAKAAHLRRLGAEIAVADVHDVETMRGVFKTGKRLFLLNPPASPDTDATEKETIRCLLAAADGSGLEKIVAESTYGAQAGDALGDLNTLYTMEEGLRAQNIPHAIIRAAYYMSNWDGILESVRNEGVLPTMFPADLKVPMVAPQDLGAVASQLLTEQVGNDGITYVEGPERYSSDDVAAAFENALHRDVKPVVTPHDEWEATYRQLGFSDAAARSYARMTAITVDGDYDIPENPIRGTVSLQAYVNALVEAG